MTVKTPSIADAYRFLSTNVSLKDMLERFFPPVDYQDNYYWIDIHNPLVKKVLSLPRTGELLYHNSTPLTTHSANYYGTTTLWWLILSCSDCLHPHQIRTNTIIKLPELQAFRAILAEEEASLFGKVITI